MSEDWPFTPEVDTGGWQVERDTEVWGGFRIDGFKEPTSDESDDNGGDFDADFERAEKEEMADANLIAAAPRMYRALKRFSRWPGVLHAAQDECREVLEWIDQR